jgi:hypothetical protein
MSKACPCFVLVVWLVAANLVSPNVIAYAQTLSGVRIGDDLASAVRQIGFQPDEADRAEPYAYAMWKLGDGNELHVTISTVNGRIVYMESDWGGLVGGRGAPETDFPGFFYGRTTQREITAVAGNWGVLYSHRTFKALSDRSGVFNNIFDVASTSNIVDLLTHAADVQIPDDVFRMLVRTGTISRADFIGNSEYVLADGTAVPSDQYVLRKMQVGRHLAENVAASVGSPQSEPLFPL